MPAHRNAQFVEHTAQARYDEREELASAAGSMSCRRSCGLTRSQRGLYPKIFVSCRHDGIFMPKRGHLRDFDARIEMQSMRRRA